MKTAIRCPLVVILFFLSCDRKNEVSFSPPNLSLIDWQPAWSPDGRWIAFLHGGSNGDGIYLISPDGKDVHLWQAGAAQNPAWSPCGQWIAFSENGQIWKKKIDGDSLTQLTFEGKNFSPTWSSCGQWIAYDAFNRGFNRDFYAIWKMSRDGEHRKMIGFSNKDGAYRIPHWEGNAIVHIRYLAGGGGSEIFSMDSAGGSARRLTFGGGRNDNPKLSADGRRVVYNAHDPRIPGFCVRTMSADSSQNRQLTFWQSDGCAWSPCGGYIAYTDARLQNGRLWVMDADGRNKRQLTFEHHFMTE